MFRAHVSIHDVSPAWSGQVEAALELCRAAGACPALLVVPNFHGTAPLLADEAFCERLRDLQALGHEIHLHGLLHLASDRYDKSRGQSRAAWMLAQRVVSGGEAEMSDINESEGRARIESGENVLKQAGLRIDGFVAPAWSMPRWLLPLLAQRGYRFTEDHWHVYDPTAGRKRASVVLNWATRSPARLLSSVLWCRVAKRARLAVPTRIAIHPSDMQYRLVRGEIERLLRWAGGAFTSRSLDLLAD